MTEQSTIFIFTSVVMGILLIYFCIALYSLKESAPSRKRYGKLSENIDKMPVRTPKTYVPPPRF
jgi:hypothetical protein